MPSPQHPEVVVVGSANMDLVSAAPRIPRPGETVLGGEFRTVHGGKGANQAVAAARLGACVAFVGRVGEDDFGRDLRAGLKNAGVDCRCLTDTPGPSGVALIVVSESGENAICVAPGANARLTPEDVAAAEPLIRAARVCVVQLEVPVAAVLSLLEIARCAGVETILDPAPAPDAADPRLFSADIVTPNGTEAATLLGLSGELVPSEAARRLRFRGARAAVLKLGAAGALVVDDAGEALVPAPHVDVVDSTGAGDAFTAALAVARAEGRSLRDATAFAVRAGSLACTRFGAQPSMPGRGELDAFRP